MFDFTTAEALLLAFKPHRYDFGSDIFSRTAQRAAHLGKRAALIRTGFSGSDAFVQQLLTNLEHEGVQTIATIRGPRPNAPIEDLLRIEQELEQANPDLLISFGGGSLIDTVKAAEVLRALGGDIEDYFGTNRVSEKLAEHKKTLTPHLAIQTAASSAAHLTKYSNITNLATGQKKLIVDDAIVPALSAFDYRTTLCAPAALTIDGALDGISHSLEVLYGAAGKPAYSQIETVALESIRLIIHALPRVLEVPDDLTLRTALGLGTDLGGYAIMLGGTNGGHLTSFSLVDLLPHGRACALLNPYYTVFFAPAIETALRAVGQLFKDAGYSSVDFSVLDGRDLGVAVARAMFAFADAIGFPTRLEQIEGFNDAHITRALEAAKNPQLKMKLENMPIPLKTDQIDPLMGSILEAARTGNLDLIRSTDID
ncbi:MAG: iron-containing alcohol dehydrogenase [Anaerolineaceae bacterium]|nr:iron-containing alcohol dehydrogenase [Anaerolineaceae bacterium]